MKDRTLIQVIASLVAARQNCLKSDVAKVSATGERWEDRHTESLEWIATNCLPHGSGFDNGTTIDLNASTGDKIVLNTSFHHMNENGFYDGWTEHKITITPAFDGFDTRVSGRNRNDIKEYIGEAIDCCLRKAAPEKFQYRPAAQPVQAPIAMEVSADPGEDAERFDGLS